MNTLVRFWADCDLKRPPYVHPADRAIVEAHPHQFDLTVRSPKQFQRSNLFGDFRSSRFHLSLLPVPYNGNLHRADIYVLLLNPGLGLSDYFVDHDVRHAAAARRVIRQQLAGLEFPFISLDPSFCWTGGFRWWEAKLRSVLTTIADEHDRSYLEALRHLSNRLAAIELVPYHSSNFTAHRIMKELPSVHAAWQFVQNVLVPKAKAGKIKIIVTRKASHWALPSSRNVIRYSGAQARGASLGIDTPGGKAILEQIRNHRRTF